MYGGEKLTILKRDARNQFPQQALLETVLAARLQFMVNAQAIIQPNCFEARRKAALCLKRFQRRKIWTKAARGHYFAKLNNEPVRFAP